MRAIIIMIEALHRLAIKLSVAMEVDPYAQCPGCVLSDRDCDLRKQPRRRHRPASRAVRMKNGSIALACISHAPFVEHYSLRDYGGRVIR